MRPPFWFFPVTITAAVVTLAVLLLSFVVWEHDKTFGEAIFLGYALVVIGGFLVAWDWPDVNYLRIAVALVLALLVTLARLPDWAFLICLAAMFAAGQFSPEFLRRRRRR